MLFPVILAIAVIVTFAGSAAAIRERWQWIPYSRCEVKHEHRLNCSGSRHCAIIPEPCGRRAQAPHTSMFVRMLVRAAVLRRGRAASALFAMVVAAAVATAMLNLYVDVQAKLRREFETTERTSLWLVKNGASLPADTPARVESVWPAVASPRRLQ